MKRFSTLLNFIYFSVEREATEEWQKEKEERLKRARVARESSGQKKIARDKADKELETFGALDEANDMDKSANNSLLKTANDVHEFQGIFLYTF